MLDQAPAVTPSGSCRLGRDVLHPHLLLCVLIHPPPAWGTGCLGRFSWQEHLAGSVQLCPGSPFLVTVPLRGAEGVVVVVAEVLLALSFLGCCLCWGCGFMWAGGRWALSTLLASGQAVSSPCPLWAEVVTSASVGLAGH